MRPVLATLLGSLALTACADNSASLSPQTDDTITASEISSGFITPGLWLLSLIANG